MTTTPQQYRIDMWTNEREGTRCFNVRHVSGRYYAAPAMARIEDMWQWVAGFRAALGVAVGNGEISCQALFVNWGDFIDWYESAPSDATRALEV